eukprot:CAMPEP_0206438700 /NCGR_PEP_ID=MMETSP0324_2-20121206/11790_1 /ASSEMBLY_ACC=CAM_ASM_000836 /TAXON_ID=2866 /ORGANISM="Crypthecodinium cohnii, Strain Seligo" /LENGTH=733 /DNA_ID=CAMNT_0053906217 /DNA_START=64 /DNA_END=2265 /DNA_ORIENTATION=-
MAQQLTMDMKKQVENAPPSAGGERKVTRLGDWVAPSQPRVSEGYAKLGDEGEGTEVLSMIKDACVARFPVLSWLPKYRWKQDFFYDFVGGATIALICLVQTLAHAAIATTDVIQGPYCAFVPPFVYAMLGTSPHASISSGAIAAILIADQLQYFHDIQERTQLACFLGLISGLWLVVMGLCKAAYLVRFLSQSLISGFVTGGSVLILEGQLKNLLGLTEMRHGVGFLDTASALYDALPTTNYVGLALGLTMMGVLQLMMWIKKWTAAELAKKGPHPGWMKPVKIISEMKELVLVALSITFAYFTMRPDGTPILPLVGDIPAGLPPFQPAYDLPASREMLETHFRLEEFIMGGFLVALTSFLTTYATSKKQALHHGYQIDASQEMFALGMAGTCGSFFGSFPPSGSLSRTSLASEVGVKTQMSGLMKIVVVGTSLQFFTPVLYYLPKATLAAIILRSTWSLVDFKTARELWEAWKPSRLGGMKRDCLVWWISFLLTIFLGVLYGIGSAVLFSLLMIVRDAAMPRMVVLGHLESLGNIWRDVEVWSEGRTFPGILVAEFRGPLSFASADWFCQELERLRLTSTNQVEIVVLSFGSVHDLDKTAIEMLRELFGEWRKRGVSCIVAEAKSRVRLLLEQYFAKPDKKNKAPLLDQPAFMITIDDAVQLAKRTLARRGREISYYTSRDDTFDVRAGPSRGSQGWRGSNTNLAAIARKEIKEDAAAGSPQPDNSRAMSQV